MNRSVRDSVRESATSAVIARAYPRAATHGRKSASARPAQRYGEERERERVGEPLGSCEGE